jgi:hypothetical protein
MSDSRYKQRESVIQGSNGDAFDSVVRKHSNGVQPPAGWSGASKMCRDVKTHVQGLNKDGWASLNTLKCCSYLCEHTQWSAQTGAARLGIRGTQPLQLGGELGVQGQAGGRDGDESVPHVRLGCRADMG